MRKKMPRRAWPFYPAQDMQARAMQGDLGHRDKAILLDLANGVERRRVARHWGLTVDRINQILDHHMGHKA